MISVKMENVMMILLTRNISFFFFRTCVIISLKWDVLGKGVVLDCYRTTLNEYDGHQQTTEAGETCVRWDMDFNKAFRDPKLFPDVSLSEAANYCRNPQYEKYSHLWCFTGNDPSEWGNCGIERCADASVNQCGHLRIEQPTILGRNVTFAFTPDTYGSNAILEWQRTNKVKPWATLPIKFKFTQYYKDGTYCLILTDTVRDDDELFYRVHYYNKSLHCLMETPRLVLRENDEQSFNDKESKKPPIWIILSSCLAAVLIVVFVACLVERHRRKKAEAKVEVNHANYSASGDESRSVHSYQLPDITGSNRCDKELDVHVYEQLKDTSCASGYSNDAYTELNPRQTKVL